MEALCFRLVCKFFRQNRIFFPLIKNFRKKQHTLIIYSFPLFFLSYTLITKPFFPQLHTPSAFFLLADKLSLLQELKNLASLLFLFQERFILLFPVFLCSPLFLPSIVRKP